MAYDGATFDSNVDNFNNRKLHAKVVDQILNAATFYSRQCSQGEPFDGKTMDFTVDIVQDTQGQFFVGLEALNSEALNSTITLSYAQTNFQQPKVGVLVEDFANQGAMAIIDLSRFKYAKAAGQAQQKLGAAIYGTGSGNQPDGLGIIVLDSGTIGGQSRATYTALNATNTAASASKLTLAQMATLYDAVSAASLEQSEPNIGVTTKTVFSLYEQLLTPSVRAEYASIGYDKMSTRAMTVTKGNQNAGAASGFNSLQYRGMPIIKDDFATSGVLFFLNESSMGWRGRTIVPDNWKPFFEKVDLGTEAVTKSYEGVGAMSLDLPSEYNGWFYQKDMILPNQAGAVGRFYVIGQMMTWEPRRNGKLTGITGV